MAAIPNYLAMVGFDVDKMKKEADGKYSLTTKQVITAEELVSFKASIQNEITNLQNRILELQDILSKINALG